jgi:hypothetical protein
MEKNMDMMTNDGFNCMDLFIDSFYRLVGIEEYSRKIVNSRLVDADLMGKEYCSVI